MQFALIYAWFLACKFVTNRHPPESGRQDSHFIQEVMPIQQQQQ